MFEPLLAGIRDLMLRLTKPPWGDRGRGLLVCHCKAVFERRVREAITAGARNEFDVAIACGAGTGCGGCVPSIIRLLREAVGCPMAETKDNRTYITSR